MDGFYHVLHGVTPVSNQTQPVASDVKAVRPVLGPINWGTPWYHPSFWATKREKKKKHIGKNSWGSNGKCALVVGKPLDLYGFIESIHFQTNP